MVTAIPNRVFSFVGGAIGRWRVVETRPVTGEPLVSVPRLDIVPADVSGRSTAGGWILRGMVSNERYVTRGEKDRLVAKQPALGRPEARSAALIPIRKNAAWWSLTQDERRAIFEDTSRHITIGLGYLPAVARRLHHCRDLSEHEPFDFLTWFEFAPQDAGAFDRLLQELRATEEWRYVEREFDVRVEREE